MRGEQTVPHRLGPPTPQTLFDWQVPQEIVPPQPSPIRPQFAPTLWQLSGVQLPAPHTFGAPPPPHALPDAQDPQLIVLPQPSAIGPHSALAEVHDRG